ncbi:MAG: hypothetical protein HKN47_18450 [Pirellulaceae bacterium]|nr:hypothetical protein [Pirellulaceae bacterium]
MRFSSFYRMPSNGDSTDNRFSLTPRDPSAAVPVRSLTECLDESRAQFDRTATDQITVDCADVVKVSSAELSHLIRLHLDARLLGIGVTLTNVDDTLCQIIQLTRIDRMVQLRIDTASNHHLPQSTLRQQQTVPK